jgi:uncharacterized protein (TIGR00251 family)
MNDARWPCVAPIDDEAVALTVQVVPNARRTEAVGLHGDALRLRLAAPAIEGRANEALVSWLAAELGLPRHAITLKHGAAGRRKRLVIACGAARVSRWLDARIG